MMVLDGTLYNCNHTWYKRVFTIILQSIHWQFFIMAKQNKGRAKRRINKHQRDHASTTVVHPSLPEDTSISTSISVPTVRLNVNDRAPPSRHTRKQDDDARRDSVLEIHQEWNKHSRTNSGHQWKEHKNWNRTPREHALHAQQWIASTWISQKISSSICWRIPQRLNLHDLLCILFLFTLAFGGLSVMVEYLLVNTRASAACSTSTVFIPFTETITSTTPASVAPGETVATTQSSSVPTLYSTISTFTTTVSRITTVTAIASSSTPPAITPATTTVTATVSVISTVTASSPFTSTTATTSTGGPSYSFYVTDGSTVWQNGVAPSSGASLDIVTTSVAVVPMPATLPPTSSSSMMSSSEASRPLTTFTPPAYSSTTFSVLSSALTTTLTSTHYITRSLSRVSLPAASSRTSFTGVNSAGWNASSTQFAAASTPIASASPRFTRFTRMVYFGHNDITTSTSTQLVTATIGEPPGSSSYTVASSSIVGPTGAPVTLSYTVGTSGISYSTSISFSSALAGLPSTYPTAAAMSTQLSNGTTLATSVLTSGQSGTGTVTDPSDGIHQTIGAASSQEATNEISRSNSRVYTSPLASSQSGTFATATVPIGSSSDAVYTITTVSSGLGTTVTITMIRSASTPTLTVVDGTTYGVTPSTIPRASANSIFTRVSVSPTLIGSPGALSGLQTSPTNGFTTEIVQTSSAAADRSSFSRNTVSSGLNTLSSGTTQPSASRESIDTGAAASRTSDLISSTISSDLVSMRSSETSAALGSSSSVRALPSSPVASSEVKPSITSSESTEVTTASRTSLSSESSVSTSPFSSRSPTSRNTTSLITSTLMVPSSPTTASPIASCGEQGNFTMDFDSLPNFGRRVRLHKRQNSTSNGTVPNSGNGTTDITQQPPLGIRPYKHMLFSGGYVYAPQPVEPFAPSSPPNVAAFLANSTGLKAGPAPPLQNGLEPGEIADGPYHNGNPAFFFDARSAALGCDSQSTPCTMEVTGYTWNDTMKDDVPTHVQNYTLPACEGYRNCQLTPVDFPPTFRNLSGIRMRAVRGSEPRTFFVDDIHARWADSSCDAGIARENSA